MEKLEWRDSLSIGVDLIDDQHKNWLNRFNNLAQAIEARERQGQLVKTLDFLVDYTKLHFDTEEKHMTANNYPGYDEHKAKHDKLKTTLDNLVDDFQDEGATQMLADYLSTFLGNWLVTHIKEVDIQFGKFLSEKGITIE